MFSFSLPLSCLLTCLFCPPPLPLSPRQHTSWAIFATAEVRRSLAQTYRGAISAQVQEMCDLCDYKIAAFHVLPSVSLLLYPDVGHPLFVFCPTVFLGQIQETITIMFQMLPLSCCCVVITTTPFLLWPLFLSLFVPTLLCAFANTAPILLLVKYPPRHQSCLAIRLSFLCPLLLGSLPPLVSTSHPVSSNFISSSSATKLPFDVWSCLVEIFGHVFPPRQFFLSRVSVVLESVDYLHLFSYPQRLIPNLYLPSFLSKTNICGPCFFFHPGNIHDTSGPRICSCSRSFQVQCLVHRLHYLLEGRVYLQGLNRASPFQASEPVRPCTTSTSTSVRPGRTFLAFVFVHKGSKRRLMALIDHFVVFSEDHTIVQ